MAHFEVQSLKRNYLLAYSARQLSRIYRLLDFKFSLQGYAAFCSAWEASCEASISLKYPGIVEKTLRTVEFLSAGLLAARQYMVPFGVAVYECQLATLYMMLWWQLYCERKPKGTVPTRQCVCFERHSLAFKILPKHMVFYYVKRSLERNPQTFLFLTGNHIFISRFSLYKDIFTCLDWKSSQCLEELRICFV